MSTTSIAEQASTALGLALEQPHAAKALAEQARSAASAAGLHSEEAVALRALGLAARALHEITASADFLSGAVEAAIRAGDPDLEAECRVTLASALVFAGESGRALGTLDGARPGTRTAVLVASQRAAILTLLGRYEEALGCYDPLVRSLRRSGNHLLESRVLTNRGLLHVYTGRFHLADVDLARAEHLAAGEGHLTEAAGHCHNRGFAAARRGDLPVALALFDRAEERYREAGVPLGARAFDQAEALLAAGLLRDARDLAERAVAAMRAGGDRFALAEGLLLLADCTYLAGDMGPSQEVAGEAAGLFSEQERPGCMALAHAALGRAALGTGDVSVEVAEAAAAAAAALDRLGFATRAIAAHAVAGKLWLAAGGADAGGEARAGSAGGETRDGTAGGETRGGTAGGEAEGGSSGGHDGGGSVRQSGMLLQRRGRDELAQAASGRRRGPAADRAVAWDAEAVRRLAAGDRRGAVSALQAAVAVVDAQQAGLSATEMRAHISLYADGSAALGLRLALASGRPRQILGWMERRRANSLRSWPVRPPPDPVLAEELAELRRLAGEVASAVTSGADPRPPARAQARLERVVRERAWRLSSSGRAQRPDDAPTPERLMDELGEWALVELAGSGGELHAVVVSDRRCSHRHLGPTSAVTRELEHLRFALRRAAYGMTGAGDAAAPLGEAAARLDHLVLDPVRRLVGDRPLVVVPTGALHALPWSALPTIAGRPLAVAPSAHAWLRASRTPPPDGALLGVAGPGLPGAAGEVRALRRIHPAVEVMTGRRATAAAVLARLEGAAVAHVAAHAVLNADNGLWSALVLSDGPLTVYELEGLARAPGLVILSACQSGLSTVRPGDEVLGLVAALLALGSRTVIASVLPVDDHATTALMVALHSRLAAGDPPATALARAQAAAADSVVAASFVCFGAR